MTIASCVTVTSCDLHPMLRIAERRLHHGRSDASLTGARRSGRRPSRRSTSSGSPPAWAATAIRSPSPPPPSRASRTSSWGPSPGCPRSTCTTRCSPTRIGDEFMKYWYQADEGRLDPFVLVVEGSIPNEKIKKEGYWAALGTDKTTGQPITTCEWIDRLAPKALAVVAAGTCATYGGIHAMEGNPTGCMGLADYLGWNWKSKAGMPIVNVPGCPVQPDNFMETLLYLLYQAAGLAPMIPLDDAAAADLAVRQDGARGLRPRRLLRAGRLRPRVRLAQVPGEARLLGAGGQLQRPQARLDGRHRRLPQRRRHLHRLHHARLPRQVHAVHGRAARRAALVDGRRHVRPASSARCAAFTNDTANKEPKWRHRGRRADHRLSSHHLRPRAKRKERPRWPPSTMPDATDHARDRATWSRCRGTRSPGSWAAWASTPRSTSPTARSPSATAPRRSSAATASS